VNHTFESYPATAGWTPDTNVMTYTTASGVFTDVTYRVHRYGSTEANQASVHVQLTHKDLGSGYDYDNRGLADICYRISGFIGNPAGGACSSATGDFLFRNVPQGTYSLVLNRNNSLCASVPSTKGFTVGAGDLGGTVEITIEVTGCAAKKGGGTCTVERTAPGRTVDLYYGTLTGAGGATLLSAVQLSETIPSILRESLLGAGNPDSTHITSATLAPWAEPYYFDSAITDWSKRPDWDGNAYQLMRNAYGGVSGDYVLGARTSHGSYQLASGVGLDFEFADGATDWSLYPECSTESDQILITITYQSTVNLYELNATENAPVTPGPTPIPSPEPVCNTTVTRDLTAYYGAVTQNGAVISNNLALSEHIPAALRDAIAAGAPPDPVEQQISTWVGSGIAGDTWYQTPAEGLDAEANLRSQLSNGGAAIGSPTDRGTATYTYTNYRYLDITDLPRGCAFQPASDEVQPAFSVLIPVMQETIVTVHYIELNATLAGSVTPTATATPSSTATPAISPTPGTTPNPTPTANPATIRGLPNTGNGAAATTNDPLLLLIAALIISVLLIGSLLLRRRA
jgi:hypothetical protein